jgi:uncharacterized protein (DUF58 family)
MPSNGWTLRSRRRILELSVGGRWYLVFTVAIGVAAIYSGNNVIYLLESLLLSALLVSGVLSELAVSRVRVRRELGYCHAGGVAEDVFVVENLGKLPLYCLELGEYVGRYREMPTFLLALPGRATVRVRSKQGIDVRGRHRWEGLLVATSFPFGFARKIRFVPDPGSRIVWPTPVDAGRRLDRENVAPLGELELVGDEVVPMEPWEDASRVHWPMTVRAGELMARPTRRILPQEEILLRLGEPCAEMEAAICRAAGSLYFARESTSPTLVLANRSERQKVIGRVRALDALALLPKPEVS